MKKFIFAIALALGIAAAAYGAAASLNVNGGTLQSGGDSSLTCTAPGGVDVSYNLDGDNNVTSVVISPLGTGGATCVGKDLVVTLTLELPAGTASTDCGLTALTDRDIVSDAETCVVSGTIAASRVTDVNISIFSDSETTGAQ